MAQAIRQQPIRLLAQPTYEGDYDIDEDPLWIHKPKALPLDALAWYHCDHLGTPQELTDHNGNVAWTGQYKAWGEVTEQRSEWARQKGLSNPLRMLRSTCCAAAASRNLHGTQRYLLKTT